MKRFFLAAGMLTVLACINIYAQISELAIARGSVPFEFQISNVTLPAGDVQISEMGNHLLKIYSFSGRRGVLVLTSPATHHGQVPGTASLQFSVYGSEHFLTNIWSADTRDGLAVPKTMRERELARRTPLTRTDEVALTVIKGSASDGR